MRKTVRNALLLMGWLLIWPQADVRADSEDARMEASAWSSILRQIRSTSSESLNLSAEMAERREVTFRIRASEALDRVRIILQDHEAESVGKSTGYGELFTEFSRLAHALNAKRELRKGLWNRELRTSIEDGIADPFSLAHERTFSHSYLVMGSGTDEVSRPLFHSSSAAAALPGYLTEIRPIGRQKSLQNLWPGIEDFSFYQPSSSLKTKEIWQLRKDFVSNVTLDIMVQSMKTLLAVQTNVSASLGIQPVDLKSWADQWIQKSYPHFFHNDRNKILSRSFSSLRQTAKNESLSWGAYISTVCTELKAEGYPFHAQPMARTQNLNSFHVPTYDRLELKAEQEWIGSRKTALERVILKVPFGYLLLTEALTLRSQGTPLEFQMNCQEPHGDENRDKMKLAVTQFHETMGKFWKDLDSSFDANNLTEREITKALRILIERSPAAVGRKLTSFSNQTPWVVQVANQFSNDRSAEKFRDNAILFGGTLAGIFIPVAGEMLVANILTQACIRVGVAVVTASKMVFEWNRAVAFEESSEDFFQYYFATSDLANLRYSKEDLERSRDLFLSFVFDLAFSYNHVRSLYRHAMALSRAGGAVELSEVNRSLINIFQREELLQRVAEVNPVKKIAKSVNRQVIKNTMKEFSDGVTREGFRSHPLQRSLSRH
jgi:hypothetical protein